MKSKKKKKQEEEEEELKRLREQMADKATTEKKWKERLSEAPEDRMISPKRRNKVEVVTR